MTCDVMVISAHPDDVEVAMGGTVARLVDQGCRVWILDLCEGEPTRHAEKGVRRQQALEAARLLGVHREFLSLQDRFIIDALDTRLQIARYLRRYRPRWVFATTDCGIHPDHRAIRDLADAAVFYARLPKWNEVPGGEVLVDTEPWEIDRLMYYYCRMEPPWDRFDFAVDVSDVYEKKRQAMAAYGAVFAGPQAGLLSRVEAMDRYFGGLVGVEYAEIFRTRSPILINDLSHLSRARFG